MSDFEITYAAHTSTCTFLLDADGVCRRIAMIETSRRSPSSSKRDGRSAARCVGAQYVASLDPTVAGMLTDMPRVGVAMLFARVDERGRVSLVRTGVVTSFEKHRAEDPFVETEKLPSMSVETSAPALTPSVSSKEPTLRAPKVEAPVDADPYTDEDDVERTQPIQALSPKALRSLAQRNGAGAPAARGLRKSVPVHDDTEDTSNDELLEDDDSLERTAEYHSTESVLSDDDHWPSSNEAPAPPTLRQVPKLLPSSSDEFEAHTTGVRTPLPVPRRSEPQVTTRRSETRSADRTPRVSHPPPTERVASRGRRDR